nr:MAG TPA: hypothetical protein [Caudoviricetes sp.]
MNKPLKLYLYLLHYRYLTSYILSLTIKYFI